MIKKGQLTFCIAILAISTFVPAIVANATPQGALSARVIRQVRHELVTLTLAATLTSVRPARYRSMA